MFHLPSGSLHQAITPSGDLANYCIGWTCRGVPIDGSRRLIDIFETRRWTVGNLHHRRYVQWRTVTSL